MNRNPIRPPNRRQPQHTDPATASIRLAHARREELEGVAGVALAHPLLFAAEAARLDISIADFDGSEDLAAAVSAALEVADIAGPNAPPLIVAEHAFTLAAVRCCPPDRVETIHPQDLAEIAHKGGRNHDLEDPFVPYPSASDRLARHVAEARRLARVAAAVAGFDADARRARLNAARVLDGVLDAADRGAA